MEFSDMDSEDEKKEASAELVVVLRQKITALDEQVAGLHMTVYDQCDNFNMLRRAITSKLKHFAKTLGDPKLYDVPSP